MAAAAAAEAAAGGKEPPAEMRGLLAGECIQGPSEGSLWGPRVGLADDDEDHQGPTYEVRTTG